MESVTFLIINRNNKDTINRCLAAIERVKYPKKEIVLVDDSSTDGSLESLVSKPNKILVNTPQRGIAHSRNVGMDHSTGSLVFIIDSDIELVRINLTKIIKLFRTHPKLVGLSGQYYSKEKNNLNKVLDLRRKYIYIEKETKASSTI